MRFTDFTEISCRDFVSRLSSSDPVPGGGGAAALVGAVGTALGNMVASLTAGKKKYAGVEEEILRLKAECGRLQEELLNQVGLDAEGFEPLSRAYRLPKEDPGRAGILEAASKKACEVPLRIMELCSEALPILREFSEKGSRLALSDAGSGAVCLKAALQAASLNVFINTGALSDRTAARELNERCEAMLTEYGKMADEIWEAVQRELSSG